MDQTTQIYQKLFENSLQGMVLRQGEKIVLVNQAFAEQVGYSIEELLVFSFEDELNLIHPEDRDIILSRYRDQLAGKDVLKSYECRFVRRWLYHHRTFLQQFGLRNKPAAAPYNNFL